MLTTEFIFLFFSKLTTGEYKLGSWRLDIGNNGELQLTGKIIIPKFQQRNKGSNEQYFFLA